MKMTCPDEERLLDYLEGRLSEEDRSRVEEHLSDCERCLEALVVTNGLLRSRDRFELEAVPPEVTEAAVSLVTSQGTVSRGALMEKLRRSVKKTVSRISDTFQVEPWGEWQPVPIRGAKKVASDDLVCLSVPFKGIQTEIEIEKTGRNRAHIRVKLHEAGKHAEGVRVTLKAGEREIASYPFDGGYVLFEDIPFGHYSISLTDRGASLGTYLFEIKEGRDVGR